MEQWIVWSGWGWRSLDLCTWLDWIGLRGRISEAHLVARLRPWKLTCRLKPREAVRLWISFYQGLIVNQTGAEELRGRREDPQDDPSPPTPLQRGNWLGFVPEQWELWGDLEYQGRWS